MKVSQRITLSICCCCFIDRVTRTLCDEVKLIFV